MVREIIITQLADDDKNEILAYWKKRNKSNVYSKKLNNLFINAINYISEHPLLGKKTTMENVRFRIVSNYFIYYQYNLSTLFILRIWDSRQNPDDLHLLD
jgi:plasmid stabilization system protein ParE